ncbi:MAG: TusE/DsrC/DsvC family sulfur relay protein [Pseudomonadota bacterium]|nr:MAG: TusE/DsrC/DsvC family sulfur relay protein [Pseudomonadota bacterium]
MTNEMTDREKEQRVLGIHTEDTVFEQWTRAAAEEIAADEGVHLAEAHWNVVEFLRDYYQSNGIPEHARQLSDALSARFAADGGLKYLYTLFPKGPVNQGNRIAGVPVPSDSADPSFGSVS